MAQIKSKLKIFTNGKSYGFMDSPLYKVKTKRKLASLLNSTIPDLNRLKIDDGNYNEFDDLKKPEKPRKIQQPVKSLDVVHSRLASLLCRISVPEYLHSGRKGRSHVTNANAHVGNHSILTTDIKAFFQSTKRDMIFTFFYKKMQCSADVADLLSDLCTCHGHIPTGSRISMPLAYWANSDMFDELYALALKHDNNMSVYVDDLTFSGGNINELFCSIVKKIIIRYGQTPHPNKTRIYGKNSVKIVTGVAVHGDELLVTNYQHYQLYSDVEVWKAIKDTENAMELNTSKRLIGRLNSLAVINRKYRDKARTIKAATSK
ncbi:reverse transcriptase family protein [Aeromonas veronii]|nr:RNA-dependent DNA polymerase [Aeromonas caviae]